MSDVKHWCPRREENGAMPGPNGEPARFFPDGDHWRHSGQNVGRGGPTWRTCSYCGSLHPDDLFAYIEAGGEIGPTDKTYKIYLPPSLDKFYFQHFGIYQRRRFIDLYNSRKIKFGFPGFFYVTPFFMTLPMTAGR